MQTDLAERLLAVFRALDAHFSPETHWWPTFSPDRPFEIVVGAILVQQTRWETVEAVIQRLMAAGMFTPHALAEADVAELAALLRPCAFYTRKARGLVQVAGHIMLHYAGDTARMLRGPTAAVRAELLGLPRIGYETADAILLYAGAHFTGMLDEYTRRLFNRLGLPGRVDWLFAPYEQVRVELEEAVRAWPLADAATHHAAYARCHALVIELSVRRCLPRQPRCDGPEYARQYTRQLDRGMQAAHDEGCPLRAQCALYRTRMASWSPGSAADEPAA